MFEDLSRQQTGGPVLSKSGHQFSSTFMMLCKDIQRGKKELSAAEALVDFGDSAAVAALVRLLKEGTLTTPEAERLLRRLGTPEAISALSGSTLGIDE